jgi:CBS domain-containing protein
MTRLARWEDCPMTNFATPISSLMTTPVVTIADTAGLVEANQLLTERGISCLAVTSGGHAVGVLSRTDLLHVGRFESRARPDGDVKAPGAVRAPLLTLPLDRTVGDVMKRSIVTVHPLEPISTAARTMGEHRIHRVFVMDDGALVGVFSTKDVLLAIRDQRLTAPISEAMSSPVLTIPLAAPLSLATDRLEKAHISGLCVIDESDWPVGTFTQNEAIAARELPETTPVEEVMSYAMLCLDMRTPLYRAAGYAHATRARRVLAVEGRQVKGVLTGLDFARIAAKG